MDAPANSPDVLERRDWAIKIARNAGQLTLEYFRQTGLAVERKSDQSPVTMADREAEKLLRRQIEERYPQDAILGEEFGAKAGSSGYQWVLDPIDGTKSFIHGVPLYSTLVALLRVDGDRSPGVPCFGVIYAPGTGELVHAVSGSGECWYRLGDGTQSLARVSQVPGLEESLLLTSEIATFGGRRAGDATAAFLALQSQVRLVRTWGDAYGYLMVATGRAEVMIDPEMNLWDAAALQPIIEEAGGEFADWNGTPTVHAGEALATNGLITPQVLHHLRGR